MASYTAVGVPLPDHVEAGGLVGGQAVVVGGRHDGHQVDARSEVTAVGDVPLVAEP